MKWVNLTKKKKVVAAGLAAGVAMGAAGISAAFIAASGNATGASQTTTFKTLVVAYASRSGPLAPGLTQTLLFHVTNNNGFNVKVGAAKAIVTHTGGGLVATANGGNIAGCYYTWFTAKVTPSYGPGTITQGTHNVTVKVLMKTVNTTEKACLGHFPKVTLTIPAP